MIQRGDDQFEWTRTTGSTPSKGTGPERAAQRQWYIFIETTNP